MKPKFANQITEKERHNHGYERGGQDYGRGFSPTRTDASADPEPGEEFVDKRRMTMRRGTKDFSDFLTPLRSFLQTNVGRQWDDVYSEISQGIPANSMQGRHIRQHVDSYVRKDVIMVDGVPHSFPEYGAGPRVLLGTPGQNFYVDPETGKLELVLLHYGLYRDTAGRSMRLETWVKQHFGKSPQRIESILMTGRGSDNKPPKQDDIYSAMNAVGYVDARGLLQAKPAGLASAQAAEKRRLEKEAAQAKLEAAENALKRSFAGRRARKRFPETT
jgi:hypothetical protein